MTRPRVLVVEDETDLVRVLAYNLQQAGYEPIAARSIAIAMDKLREQPPDAVLLDVMLPDGSGTDLCRTIKSDSRWKSIPVIMVTARGEEVDRIVGLELGADDYVVKPYSVRELMLRVRAVLRRSEAGSVASATTVFGRLRVDPTAHRVFVDEQEVTLTALEFKLLTTLMERKNRVQSRDSLLEDVWGIYLNVETRTIDTHVKRLREKLGAAGAYIHTVRGVGYRFAETPQAGPPVSS